MSPALKPGDQAILRVGDVVLSAAGLAGVIVTAVRSAGRRRKTAKSGGVPLTG
jgi:hypothetical protein